MNKLMTVATIAPSIVSSNMMMRLGHNRHVSGVQRPGLLGSGRQQVAQHQAEDASGGSNPEYPGRLVAMAELILFEWLGRNDRDLAIRHANPPQAVDGALC